MSDKYFRLHYTLQEQKKIFITIATTKKWNRKAGMYYKTTDKNFGNWK